MSSNLHKNELGYGIYTIPDISRLLGFPQSKVRRYLLEYWDERIGKKLFNEKYSWTTDGRTKAVNFYALIELYSFFKLQEFGVPTKEILKSREHMAKHLKSPYPFANSGLLINGKKIWYEFQDCIIDADGTLQTNFIEIIKSFANKIEFNNNKLAAKFYPAGKNNSIVVDPHHQFGRPIINGSNVNTEVIFSMYQSGEPVNSIGILYDLTSSEVEQAIAFHKQAA